MNYPKLLFSALFFLLVACHGPNSENKQGIDASAEYLAGVHLLHNNRKIPRYDEQAMRLEQLQKVTGITSETMITQLSALKNHPQKAIDLYDRMVELSTDTTDTISTNKK